jgi:hypothetical protein
MLIRFTMTLATWSRRTNTRAISKNGSAYLFPLRLIPLP